MPEEMPERSPVEFSPAKRLELIGEDEREYELYDKGSPERLINYIRETVIKTLKQMGIDPKDVVFSGYNSEEGDASNDRKMENTRGNIHDEITILTTFLMTIPTKKRCTKKDSMN